MRKVLLFIRESITVQLSDMSKSKWALLEKYFSAIRLRNEAEAFFHSTHFRARTNEKRHTCLRNESANRYPRRGDSHVERSPNDREYICGLYVKQYQLL